MKNIEHKCSEQNLCERNEDVRVMSRSEYRDKFHEAMSEYTQVYERLDE